MNFFNIIASETSIFVFSTYKLKQDPEKVERQENQHLTEKNWREVDNVNFQMILTIKSSNHWEQLELNVAGVIFHHPAQIAKPRTKKTIATGGCNCSKLYSDVSL